MKGWHHTHDGLYFLREEDGSVSVRFVWDDPNEESYFRKTVTLSPSEWASAITEVAAIADGVAFEIASRLHAGTLPPASFQDRDPAREPSE